MPVSKSLRPVNLRFLSRKVHLVRKISISDFISGLAIHFTNIYISIYICIYNRGNEKSILHRYATLSFLPLRCSGILYIFCLPKINKNRNTKVFLTNKVTKLNLDAKKIADKLSISDRVDRLQKNEGYITAKDQKENFQNSLTFRHIIQLRQISVKSARPYRIKSIKT